MSTDVNLNRGLQNIINNQPISNGSIWFAEDSQNLYIDSQDGQRIQITDVIDISYITNKELLKYYPNKIYIDGTTLKKYNSTTEKLETISELESKVLKSDNEFIYDSTDVSKATLLDKSSPKSGTIVIDKNGDAGVVTSSTSTLVNVLIITNNKSKNVLTGYDIYFDSNYTGKQVGTFNSPFSDANYLINECQDLLIDDVYVTIHIQSNSDFSFNYEDETKIKLKHITFIGTLTSKLDLISFKNCTLTNITFKNLILKNSEINEDIDVIENGYNVLIDNCHSGSDTSTLTFKSCNNIKYNNSTLYSIRIRGKSNVTVNNSKILYTLKCTGGQGNIVINNSTVYMLQSTGSLIDNDYKYTLNNTIISNNISCICNSITLNSGYINANGSITIQYSNTIKFGTFKFNGVNPTIIVGDSVNNTEDYTGLLSKQVYDTKTRDYKNTKSNLESHLDAINNSLNELNSKINSSSGGGSGETVSTEYFMSKNTFKVVSDLEGTEWRTGDVMKYIGSTSTQYNKNHSLEVIKVIDKTDYLDFYFNFTNASYIIKYGDYIDITYNTDDDGPINMSLLVFFIDKDSIICRLEKTDAKANIFVAFNETDENYETEKNKYINVWYEHTITLNQGDRIIYIKNDWDKLVDNNDSNTENYKIVDTIANLNLIMTDDTRPLGLLAYVIENETMYQWVEQDSTAQWIKIFSSNNVPEYIKPEYISTELDASNWNDNIYSFELEYPHNDYDIEINLNGDIVTSEQKVSFDNAELIGLFNTNSVKAFGDIPTINIPVILKVVKK